jgi:radical SAM superfamily enzyme YgiQ (UPF0313 family)
MTETLNTDRNKPFVIYLANLTHTYMALANANFPLGVSYVASAIKHYFKKDVHIEIFKYADDLERSIKLTKPDAFFFSSYVWTHNLPSEFARKLKDADPRILIVGGGPNISKDIEKQKEYLQANPYVDFFIRYEGEGPACNLLENYFDVNLNINKLKQIDMPSVITLLPDGTIKAGEIAPRIGVTRKKAKFHYNTAIDAYRSFDDLPSPYLTGLMDKFFDNKLYPLIETNRGCPFTCSFCQQGAGYFLKLGYQTLDRVVEELDYIAHKMSKSSPNIFHLEIADSNFAMYKQDLEICEHIRTLQDKYNWPRYIGVSTGKNQPERILNAVSKLVPDSILVTNSMQSTNEKTLEEIKRSNISLDGYKVIQTEIHRRGLRSMADVILGLPLETKKTHFEAVYSLIDSGVQEFTSYQAMILKGTDFEFESYKNRYGIETKWRILPRAIGEYQICEESIFTLEAEEITVSTNTLTFSAYLESRCLHLITMVYNNSKVFDLVYQYLESLSIPRSRYIKTINRLAKKKEFRLKPPFDEFISDTKNELFDSEGECLNFYKQPKALKSVKKGEMGNNLLWTYLSVVLFEYWEEAVDVALTALQEVTSVPDDVLSDLFTYLSFRIASPAYAQTETNNIIQINSNRIKDLLEKDDEEIFSTSNKINMKLSKDKYEVVEHAKKIYDNNRTGWSLMLSTSRVHTFIREPTNI